MCRNPLEYPNGVAQHEGNRKHGFRHPECRLAPSTQHRLSCQGALPRLNPLGGRGILGVTSPVLLPGRSYGKCQFTHGHGIPGSRQQAAWPRRHRVPTRRWVVSCPMQKTGVPRRRTEVSSDGHSPPRGYPVPPGSLLAVARMRQPIAGPRFIVKAAQDDFANPVLFHNIRSAVHRFAEEGSPCKRNQCASVTRTGGLQDRHGVHPYEFHHTKVSF